MNKFEKQLEKWNNGVLRGAQAKLAKTLGVSTATTALWATGKRRPSKGYASQIAALFKMDIYNVFKLFEKHSTVYPTPTPTAQHFLCERENTSSFHGEETLEEYALPQSNSVRLPFFNQVPAHFPQYNEDEVLEWWGVPRRYACGAKYIVPSLSIGLPTTDSDDLCFIKPATETADKNLILYKLEDGSYTCKKPTPVSKAKVAGIVVRRIATPK